MEMIRMPIPSEPTTYHFLISDNRKRLSLSFKLVVDPVDGIHFIPDLQKGRDDQVIKVLDSNLQGHIKFPWSNLPIFFRKVSAPNGKRRRFLPTLCRSSA